MIPTPSCDDALALAGIDGLAKCGEGYHYGVHPIRRFRGTWQATYATPGPGWVVVKRGGFVSIQAACDWIDACLLIDTF